MFSALCAAAMVTSVSAQGGKDMLSNGIKYLDVPYVAHTLEADGPEELVINCDEVDCTTLGCGSDEHRPFLRYDFWFRDNKKIWNRLRGRYVCS